MCIGKGVGYTAFACGHTDLLMTPTSDETLANTFLMKMDQWVSEIP